MVKKNPIFIAVLTLGLLGGQVHAATAPRPNPASALPEDATLLERSQIAYRAEGGFTGVESYSVIISCVRGEVSMMATIRDPRLKSTEPLRKFGHITPQAYLDLWRSLHRQGGLRMSDGPDPKRDIRDEFTVSFNLTVGDENHQFQAQGLSLPESARYQAILRLIDDTAQMASLWEQHAEIVGVERVSTVTWETLLSNVSDETGL